MEIVTKTAAASDLLAVIEGELMNATVKIEKALCINQDLSEGYFDLTDLTKENLWKLQCGYFEHATKASIVFDYIYAVSGLLEKIEKLVIEARKELKGAGRKINLKEVIRKAEEQE